MLLVCIFIIIILGIIILKRPRTIIWMGRYIRNKLLYKKYKLLLRVFPGRTVHQPLSPGLSHIATNSYTNIRRRLAIF